MGGRRRLVVVGGDAAGMSGASQALRQSRARGEELEVVVLEATDVVSYTACGIPYWMAGDVDDRDALIVRTPEEHRANGIDLRVMHEAMGVDLDARTVEVRDHTSGTTTSIEFDDLLIATGAEPIMPSWAQGIDAVLPVKTLDDGARWRELIRRGPKCALVVGGGYIGIEVAETFARHGIRTTLVNRSDGVMTGSLEPEMSALVCKALADAGVEVVTGIEVTNLDETPGAGVRAACIGGQELEADVVALGLGVRARAQIAADAGLPIGEHGGMVPNDRQLLADGVWAAGDCCEVHDRTLDRSIFVPLGTHANKAGRVAGTNIAGGSMTFPGIVGTAIVRAGTAEVGRTGITRAWADRLGLEVDEVRMQSTTASGYMPESDPVTVWVMAERSTGRLLGCQIVGGRGAGKRIDTMATAMWAGMTVADVAMSDLSYAPPFSPVWDPVQIASRKLAGM